MMRRLPRMVFVSALASLSVGCGAPAGPLCASLGNNEACLTEHYLRGYNPASPAPCVPVPPERRLGRSVQLGLFFGGGEADPAVVDTGLRLQQFFDAYDLWFFTRAPASDAGLEYALRGSAGELDGALERAGVPADRPLTAAEEQLANRAVGEIIFADLRRFVAEHGAAEAPFVNVVVLRSVMSPELATATYGASSEAYMMGFGISPALFLQASADDPARQLYGMTGLEPSFTPVVFIGTAELARFGGNPANVVAHEMGHALGLAHVAEPGNLLTPGERLDCGAALSAAQSDQLRAELAAAPGAVSRAGALSTDWTALTKAVVSGRQRARREARRW